MVLNCRTKVVEDTRNSHTTRLVYRDEKVRMGNQPSQPSHDRIESGDLLSKYREVSRVGQNETDRALSRVKKATFFALEMYSKVDAKAKLRGHRLILY